MSVIAARIPGLWSLKATLKAFAKKINGVFEIIHFENKSKGSDLKTCYLRLSERLDPELIIQKLGSIKFSKHGYCSAYIPDKIPDFPMSKPKKLTDKKRRRFGIREELTPAQVIVLTHQEIMTELQSKYGELYNLSAKTGHRLLKKLAYLVSDRLKQLMHSNASLQTSCFLLSKAYRKAHPHFGDFQCILSNLHQIEDADVSGKPRTQLNEQDLMVSIPSPYMINNIPYAQVKSSCQKYSDRISKKITEHIMSLDTEPDSGAETEEDAARRRVRAELKKLQPYMGPMIQQVISRHLVPEKMAFHRIRIYGEPFLPSRDVMTEFLVRWRPVKLNRSDRMYNLIRFNVSPDLFTDLVSMDGTVVGGAKISIRCSDMPTYIIPQELIEQMKAEFGGSNEAVPYQDDKLHYFDKAVYVDEPMATGDDGYDGYVEGTEDWD